MSRWKRMMLLALTLFYVSAMAHCPLEQAGFLGENGCCAGIGQAEESQKTSCEDGCCALESSVYLGRQKTSHDVSVISVYSFVVCTFEADLAQTFTLPSLAVSPPELPKIWQFSYRTALPPRAPTLVS